MGRLYRQLKELEESDYYPFHMPGHKRVMTGAEGSLGRIYGLDITEIDGFDQLHQPQGVLQDLQQRIADLYGADHSRILVNGSTCGILTAVMAAVPRGGRLLMARNCHKSVYHAAMLQELKTTYLYPDLIQGWEIADAIDPEAVERHLREEPDVAAVLVTSPTYEGIVSDIEAIAAAVHRWGKVLIVDEAHGAHLGLAPGYPKSAIHQGADLVIQSLHKTMPAMTQTAVLHMCGARVSKERVDRYLETLQTSSPSYVLMASIEACLDLAEQEGRQRLETLLDHRKKLKEALSGCSGIRILEHPAGDPCKIVIGSSMGGRQLYERLRNRYHLQMEMAADSYVLAILSMMDTEAGMDRLIRGLLETGQEAEALWSVGGAQNQSVEAVSCEKAETEMTIARACELEWEEIPLAEGAGRIAADFVGPYPPGIPWAVPGERLSGQMIRRLAEMTGSTGTAGIKNLSEMADTSETTGIGETTDIVGKTGSTKRTDSTEMMKETGSTIQGINNGGIRVIRTGIL